MRLMLQPVQIGRNMGIHPADSFPTSPDLKVAWSCVVDDTPQIWSSIIPWLATATQVAGIDPSRIFVHHVCDLRPEVALLCEKLGVNAIPVRPFDGRSPHCNKIQQCSTDFRDADRVVLTDVDVVFAGKPPLHEVSAPVAGKLVDLPNPPLDVLRRIFDRADVAVPFCYAANYKARDQETVEFDTLMGNFNGGLYVVDRSLLSALGRRWAHWAGWLLERADLLERWRVHVDQVGFCLALADHGAPCELLPDAWNFPTHIEVAPPAAEPIILHHHGRLDPHLRLEQAKTRGLGQAISRVNLAIEAFQRGHFDNRSFWNHRYAHHGSLGSGLGSRGDVLQLKRRILGELIAANPESSVLDWGCGDLEVSRELPCRDYTGVDISVEALRIGEGKRPDWRFMTPVQFDAEDGMRRDLVLCLDVLIHQPTYAQYMELTTKLVQMARRGALLAGFERNPDTSSHITYFYEPLGETLAGLPGVASVRPVAEYRDTVLYFVDMEPAGNSVPLDGRCLMDLARRLSS